jgi:hypothetical protein
MARFAIILGLAVIARRSFAFVLLSGFAKLIDQ